jgi:hypothetical protein
MVIGTFDNETNGRARQRYVQIELAFWGFLVINTRKSNNHAKKTQKNDKKQVVIGIFILLFCIVNIITIYATYKQPQLCLL